MFIAIAFPAILMFAVVFVLPHSPRELILDGKIKEAKNTFYYYMEPPDPRKLWVNYNNHSTPVEQVYFPTAKKCSFYV
jgi:hypothetical protein